MTKDITIFGKGKMGQAIASYFERVGIDVQFIGREKEEIRGKFVILAIPHEEMSGTLANYQESLKDKVVIEISNPLDYQTKTSKLDVDQSMALVLAEEFSDLNFIKAFNTNFSSSRIESAEKPLVLFAGDDKDAKEEFAQILEKASFNAVDAGSLEASRDLEVFARVQMALFGSGDTSSLEKFAL